MAKNIGVFNVNDDVNGAFWTGWATGLATGLLIGLVMCDITSKVDTKIELTEPHKIEAASNIVDEKN